MSEDTIYREDAIKAINLRARIPHDVASALYASMAINAICSVPSADRPQGEWIATSSGHWKCSRCDCRAGFWFEEENSCEWSMDMSEWLSDYCPSCGARMKGADDED